MFSLQGRESIDDSHPIFRKRYIVEKSICEIEQDDYLYYTLVRFQSFYAWGKCVLFQLKEQGLLDVKLQPEKKKDMEMDLGLVQTILTEQPFHVVR